MWEHSAEENFELIIVVVVAVLLFFSCLSQYKMAQFTQDLEVFETPDYDLESYNYDDDQKSAAIQQIEASMMTSFGKFKDKTLDNKDVDFSDSITKKPCHRGFNLQPTEFEGMTSERQPETVMERYLRLKEEVEQFTSDVQRLAETRDNAEKLLDISPSDLLNEALQLQKQMHGLQLDRIMGSKTTTGAEHPYHALCLRSLKAQVEALQTTTAHDSKPSDEKQAMYEVYTKTEAAKFAHLSKLSEVEMRLAQLERVVGNEESTVSAVTGGLDSKEKDLSAAVMNLQARVAMLDSDHITNISQQVEGLLSLLSKIDKFKRKSEDTEMAVKVKEALDTIGRLSTVMPMVPEVVERLHALRELHERASQFAGSVTYISDQQDQMTKQIKELASLLKEVQSSIQDNVASLHSEFKNIGSKIEK